MSSGARLRAAPGSQLTSCSVSYRTNLVTQHGSSPEQFDVDTQTLTKFAKPCKFAEPARICLKVKMPAYHISIVCTCPLGRIDNVALKRWAFFTVE
jgi:hypothetical protein